MAVVLLDTSYLLALEIANDQNHRSAIQHWHKITKSLPQLVTTSFILDEVATYFNSRGYHAKAVQVGNNLLTSPSVQFIHIDAGLLFEGWSYFQQHDDKDYSLTDCISFVIMRKMGITTALSFD